MAAHYLIAIFQTNVQVGITRIGSPEANIPQDIQLVGSHIINEHCVFENNDGEAIGTRLISKFDFPFSGEVNLLPCPEALCYVNGRKVTGHDNHNVDDNDFLSR